MKVQFEIEIDDRLVKAIDYYANYGKLESSDAGCKKCVFHGLCSSWANDVFNKFPEYSVETKFPCWPSTNDRRHGTNRKAIVLRK